jgi:cell division transport system permease protein
MSSRIPKSKSKLGSFPTTNVLFTTMLALFVVGLFGLLLLHAARLTNIIQENVTIQVYLHKSLSENEIIRINQLLSKQDFVLKIQDIPQIRFLSKEKAAKEFTKETGENFLQVLDENPLRDTYVLHIDPQFQHKEDLQAIKHNIEAINGVFEVDYMENLVASIHKNIARVGLILGIFAAILLLVVVVLINNTIKLATYSQRFLIRSMNLVGATDSFIRRPFLARAILIGLLAGTMANVLLLTLLYYANLQIESLAKLQQPIKIFMLLGFIPMLGSLITLLGTYQATNRYLRISLEDLY